MNRHNELYFSVDVETDGPIPGPHSMLSLGAVAITAAGQTYGEFSRNLEPLPSAAPDRRTMEEFWGKNPELYALATKDPEPPGKVMHEFNDWIESMCAIHHSLPVFVAFPAGFDFTFVHWYLISYVKNNPFSHSALDIKTLAMAALGCHYRDATKRNWPKRWFPHRHKHAHVALLDAKEQAVMFCNIMREMKSRKALEMV